MTESVLSSLLELGLMALLVAGCFAVTAGLM
jgi:hypothetical protein